MVKLFKRPFAFDHSRIFVFRSEKHGTICLRDEESLCSSEVLMKYIRWYNFSFLPFEESMTNVPGKELKVEDFIFYESFHYINFYKDV